MVMASTPVLASMRAWLGWLLLLSPVLWWLASPAVAAESLGSDRPMSTADVAGPAVIGFDLGSIDADGLIGPPDGKRALDYEFCIPRGEDYVVAVRAIDVTAQFFDRSRGRIGCGPQQILVIGHTHRPDFAAVLRRLAELPYVERIEQAYFE
jgi:hypothetical protein